MPTTNTIPKPAENGQREIDKNQAAVEKHNAEQRRRRAFDKVAGTPKGQTPTPDRNGVLAEGM